MSGIFAAPELKTNIRIKIRRFPVLKDSGSDLHSPCKKTNRPLTDPNKPTQLMITSDSVSPRGSNTLYDLFCPLSFLEDTPECGNILVV